MFEIIRIQEAQRHGFLSSKVRGDQTIVQQHRKPLTE